MEEIAKRVTSNTERIVALETNQSHILKKLDKTGNAMITLSVSIIAAVVLAILKLIF